MASNPVFRVIDAFDGPHRGRILRLRLETGDAPSIRDLRDARLRAVSPDGVERYLRVDGFPAFFGKPSDDRLRRTGRIDLHVSTEGDRHDPAVGLRWEVAAA